MNILVLTFFYHPDLSACSFRATALVKALNREISEDDSIEVITTMPHRYNSFSETAKEIEVQGNVTIRRFKIITHSTGFLSQVKSFSSFFLSNLE